MIGLTVEHADEWACELREVSETKVVVAVVTMRESTKITKNGTEADTVTLVHHQRHTFKLQSASVPPRAHVSQTDVSFRLQFPSVCDHKCRLQRFAMWQRLKV